MEATGRLRWDDLKVEEIRLDDAFPGATLVALRVRDEGLVFLGAHAGLVDGTQRIRHALEDFARARAAMVVAEGAPGLAVLDAVRKSGGTPFARSLAHDIEAGTDRAKAEMRALAMALSLDDPYRATRRIEAESFFEGDDALYRTVKAAHDRVAAVHDEPGTVLAGARRLEAAVPGPHTLLSRMRAFLRGEPPVEDGTIVFGEDEGGNLTATLGSILVQPDGDAGYCRRPPGGGPVELTAIVSFDPDSIEFDGEGGIEYLGCRLALAHDPATWSPVEDGRLYTDQPTQDAVDALFARLGLPGEPGWSESGMQGDEAGDMDVSPELAEKLWPDVVAAKRAEFLAGSAPGKA